MKRAKYSADMLAKSTPWTGAENGGYLQKSINSLSESPQKVIDLSGDLLYQFIINDIEGINIVNIKTRNDNPNLQ